MTLKCRLETNLLTTPRHAYGQYILSPWGYNCTIVPEDVGKHIQLSARLSEVIRDYGGYK